MSPPPTAVLPSSLTEGVYVQFGCGWVAPSGWINFDASPTLLFERLPAIGKLYTKNRRRFPSSVRYGDIVQGLPIKEGTVDLLYASHVLEHLCYTDCLVALRNCCRMLRRGGVFRLVVPDLEKRAELYLDGVRAGLAQASAAFMTGTCLGERERRSGFIGLVSKLFGKSAHLWMWDEPSMSRALRDAGFGRVRRCLMGDNPHPAFGLVEERGRFFFDDDVPELAMEAVK